MLAETAVKKLGEPKFIQERDRRTSLLEIHWRRSDRVNCTEEQGSQPHNRRHTGFIQNAVLPMIQLFGS